MKDLSLALESSCDDSSISLITQNRVLFEKTISQIESIKKYGGVFPEVVARTHVTNFIKLFKELNYKVKDWKERIRRVSYTIDPGFIGSLVISKCFAEIISLNLFNKVSPIHVMEIEDKYEKEEIKLVLVNHLDGHLYSPFLLTPPKFPFIGTIISGGHTRIYYVEKFNNKKLIAKTRDDAIGEAYDKIGRFFKINFPWGKNIDDLVGNDLLNFIPSIDIKSPLLKDGSFSFSGIKTKIIMSAKKEKYLLEEKRKKFLMSFQKIAQEAIYERILQLSNEFKTKNIVISGGVACNSYLRKLLKDNENLNSFIPLKHHCTDNATMIANVTWQALNAIHSKKLLNIYNKGRWENGISF